MSNREVMQQALDALVQLDGLDTETECVTIDVGDAITALKAALEQQQAEPVAWRYALDASVEGPRWIYTDKDPHQWLKGPSMACAVIEPLYTTPPQRKPFGILAITTAYEQGVGKGHQAHRRSVEIENPYAPGECQQAWALGYDEGKEQAASKAAHDIKEKT